MQNKFSFVLVNPQLGENIGSCARALKNFGFSNLSLVEPRDGWPNTKARMTSVGAYDIVKSAKVFDNVENAIKDFDIVLATSARSRDIQKKYISLDQMGNFLKKYNNSNIGILFGPESSGLSNHDLSLANFIIQIPTSNKLTSLNLSHDQIYSYSDYNNSRAFHKPFSFPAESSFKTQNYFNLVKNNLINSQNQDKCK